MSKTSLIRSLAIFCATLSLIMILTGCGGDDNSQAPTAQQLIQKSQAAIQKVSAYHFNLKAQNVGSESKLPIQSADGDIVTPDKLQATANVLFGGATAQAQMIAIGDKQYLNIFGGWQPTTGLLDPRVLSDPQKGVAAILGQLQNPSKPVSSTTDGTPCWSINGKLDPNYLSGITGGGAPTGTMDDVNVCIGKSDNLPYLIVVTGVATTGDSAKTVRTFKLSKFNEKITITAPQVTSNS